MEVGGEAVVREIGWSPEPGQSRHRHVAALFAAAWECVEDVQVRAVLGQLRGYLELDGPLFDHGGAPRRLELRGRVGVFEWEGLARLLGRVPAEQAVVVDARGLALLAAPARSLVRRFARRAGPLAWVVSPGSRELLHAARVPGRQMFGELAAALRGVGG